MKLRYFKPTSLFAAFALLTAPRFDAQAESTTTYQVNDGRENLKVVVKGEPEFTDDDSDIKNISTGGSILIEKKDKTGRHRIDIWVSKARGMNREYVRDGRSRPWEPEGREWLAQMLPGLIRELALNAPARVQRIRASKGDAGVLDEIALIRNDGAKRAYFQELFDDSPKSPEILDRAAGQIGKEIHSDGDKAAVLKRAAGAYLKSADALESYFKAAQTMHSDGDRRSVLSAVLKHKAAAAPAVKLAIESSASMRSDGDKSDVLVKALAVSNSDEALLLACLAAADSIHSDGDRRRVLSELLRHPSIGEKVFQRLFETAGRMNSDGDKSSVLVAAASSAPNGGALIDGFLAAAKTMHSDGDTLRALAAWVERDNVSGIELETLRAFGRREINNDGDRRQLEDKIGRKQRLTRQ